MYRRIGFMHTNTYGTHCRKRRKNARRDLLGNGFYQPLRRPFRDRAYDLVNIRIIHRRRELVPDTRRPQIKQQLRVCNESLRDLTLMRQHAVT